MGSNRLEELRAGLRGSVATPSDAGYDQARLIWNGHVEKRPSVVVRCAGVADVIDAVQYAREAGLGVSVRGGGHHVAGSSLLDDGLVVNLGDMRSVVVDPGTGRVRAEGGAQIGDVDRETQAFGLAVPLGLVSETGIGGLTLAGGYGWQRRKHGLSCDNLLSADVVTADGRLLHASPTENEDLFWALQGGGWNLGVVTSFEMQAHPIGPEVFMTFVTYPLSEGKEVLEAFHAFMQNAPDELSCLAVCWTFPDAAPFPEELWGKPFVAIVGPYAGAADDGERVTRPLRELGTVLTDMSERQPWVDAQRFFDEDYPTGMRYYWKSAYVRAFDAGVIDVLLELAAERPSQLTSIDVWPLGGAVSRLGAGTPAPGRDAPYMIGVESNWTEPGEDDANIAFARDAVARLEPFSTGGTYLNFEDLSDPSVARAAHGVHHERLAAIKDKYDPGGLFRSSRVGVTS